MKRVALVALAMLSLVGCKGKSDSPAVAVPDATTTSSVPATTTTTTSAAAPAALPATAEDAAKKLYAAWKAGDRPAADKVAAKAAADELFKHPYTGPDLTFQGCNPAAKGEDCFWSYEGGGMTMHVTKEPTGYRVGTIEYVAD